MLINLNLCYLIKIYIKILYIMRFSYNFIHIVQIINNGGRTIKN